MAQPQATVTFEYANGAISGAGPVPRVGMRSMALAAKTLHPIGDFGFSYAARVLRTLFPAKCRVVIHYPEGRFVFPYGDGYWSLLLNRNHVYEEEVEAFLLAIRDVDYGFVDCGANYGYWSILASSEHYGRHPVVAVEADRENFGLLRENWALNGERFEIVNAAVAASDGEIVSIYGRKHEARSILGDGRSQPRCSVRTIGLDTLAERPAVAGDRPLVLKLDIEGVEVAALRGSRRALDRDVVLIYEDHGNDPDHAVTRYLMEEAGMTVFAFERRRFFPVRSPRDLTPLKTNPRKGYDFFATRCDFWRGKLEHLAARTTG